MNLIGGIQLALFLGALLLLTKPVGLYLVRVLEPDGRTFLDPIFKPVERALYRILKVDPTVEQGWKRYTLSLLVFSAVGLLFTFAILRLQHLLPLNPRHLGPVRADLAFNTAVSFTTNTNWQNYAGEATLSYFSQMVGLVFHNFVSAAAGIAVAAALVRGLARHTAKTIGNFWTDLVRINLYLLLPLSLVFSALPDLPGRRSRISSLTNRSPRSRRAAPAAAPQTLAQGPAASQVAIKMLGTNGGGFFNANAAHPYENSDAAVQFPPDAVHLPHPRRPDLLPGAQGEEPEARLGRLDGHGRPLPGRPARGLGGRKRRESPFRRGSASIRRRATWRARKSASASSIPRSSPR